MPHSSAPLAAFCAVATRFNSGSSSFRDPESAMCELRICSLASSNSGRSASAAATNVCGSRTGSCAGTSMGVLGCTRAARTPSSAVPRRVSTVFRINSCCRSNPCEFARSCRAAATCALRARQLHRRHRALFHLDAIVLVQPLRQVSSVPRSTRMEPSALDARAGGGGATGDGERFRDRRRGSRIPKLETLWVDENRSSRESPRRGDYPITLDKLL